MAQSQNNNGSDKAADPQKPAETKKPMSPAKRLLLVIVIAIVVVIAIIAGLRFFAYASSHQTTDDAQVDADIVAVTSQISERVNTISVDTNQFVRRGDVLIRLDSHDEQQRYNQLHASYDAQLAQASAARQNVNLIVDQQRAQVQQNNGSIEQARASITSAQQQSSQAADQIRVAQADVITAQAQLRAAQAVLPGITQTLRRDLADLERSRSLVRTGDAAASTLDAAIATEATAASNRDQALANVRVQESNVAASLEKLQAARSAFGASQSAVALQSATLTTAEGKLSESSSPYRVSSQQSSADASFAQVATAKAQLAQARDQLNYTVIRAPIDGYIGEKSVEAGKTVAPGETLLTLVPSNHTYVTANYKETQIGPMRVGQSVDVTVDAYHGRTFTGHVAALGPASENTYSLVPAQNATGNFVKITQRLPVRIRVDSGVDENHPLRVGMSVETAVKVK